jgi:hypothetical protein
LPPRIALQRLFRHVLDAGHLGILQIGLIIKQAVRCHVSPVCGPLPRRLLRLQVHVLQVPIGVLGNRRGPVERILLAGEGLLPGGTLGVLREQGGCHKAASLLLRIDLNIQIHVRPSIIIVSVLVTRLVFTQFVIVGR